MIEISLKNIKKSYAADIVLKDVNFEIQTKDRIGLVGRNGTGKTTIFKIIAGYEDYDGGVLSSRKNLKVGYLDQIPVFPNSWRVIDVLNTAFSELLNLKKRMRELEKEMEKLSDIGDVPNELITEYTRIQLKFEQTGGYEYETRLEKICTGLKLDHDFRTRLFSTLSGGEKSIVVLGKILLQDCDILLLDEPTNHLDINSIEWLETYLKEFTGGVMIISHDRYFLDKAVNKIVDMEDQQTETYHGNYTAYAKEKDRRLFAQFEQHKNQEKQIKAMREAIKRFRDWGNRGGGEKMYRKAANMEKRIERMEKIDKPVLDRKKININLSGSGRSGKDVIRISKLSKCFENRKLLTDISCDIRLKEHVAILGKNGSGKSTIFKLILGTELPDKGDIYVGPSVRIGYLEQEIIFDKPERSILEELRYTLELDQQKARATLAKFLFFKDDVFKKIKRLSGGELVRLRLCLLMHKDINLLMLDEPTNHLDIDSREMFEQAIENFDGTIIFISHDRYFINKMADRIIVINNESLQNYPGNYDYYKEKTMAAPLNGIGSAGRKGENKKIDKIKISNKITKKHQINIEREKNKLEKKIENLEIRINEIENEAENNPSDYEKQQELYESKTTIQKKLDDLLEKLIGLEG